MGNYILDDWAHLSAEYLLLEIQRGLLTPPSAVSMRRIADQIGTTPQNVGMALDYMIPIMKDKGYLLGRISGKPVKIGIKIFLARRE